MKRALLSVISILGLIVPETARAELASDTRTAPPASQWAELRPGAALIVIVADEPDDDASSRLQRDLRSLGFAVVLLSATPENSSNTAALERAARELGGIAGVRLLANSRGSELWLFEPATGETVTRSLPRTDGAAADPNEVALGTLELLRASMMEVHARPRTLGQARPDRSAEPLASERVPESRPAPAVFSLSGGVAAEVGLRSVGPSLSTLWAAWFRVGGCFGVRGFAALPLIAEAAELVEGRVEVEPLLLGAGLSCALPDSTGSFWPRVSLGFAAAHVTTRGTAIDPSRSSEAAAWLGGAYGLLGVSARVARQVRLNLDVTAVVLPTPAIIVASQREVGTWGAPGAMVSVGVEVMSQR